MATSPMTPQPMGSKPASYEICIKVAGDSISVYSEPGEAEGEEGMGMDPGAMQAGEVDNEAAAIPAGSMDEAMAIAKQIHANGGAMPKADGMSPEEAFSAGFQGTEVA